MHLKISYFGIEDVTKSYEESQKPVMIRVTVNLRELLIISQSADKIKAALKCAYL